MGYGNRPSPVEFISAWFRARGVEFNADRAEDRILADRENDKARRDSHVDRVRELAATVRKAREKTSVEEFAWRENPSPTNLTRTLAAHRVRGDAEQALLEACQNDRVLMNRVLRQV
jgi:hypothetical protein